MIVDTAYWKELNMDKSNNELDTMGIIKMPVFKLSPSSLNLIEECPRCFWLDKHKVWKRPSGIFPSLPSGMDKVLKEHFDNFMKKGILPPELKKNGIDDSYKLFDDVELLEVWRNNRKGIRWEDNDRNVFYGAVDNILVKGKKLIVLDYKTRGFPLKEDTAEKYQNQLNTYNFLLRKNNHETEDYAYLLFYYPNKVHENGDVDFHAELVKMKINVEDAEKIFKKAIRLLNEDCPQKTCEWCEGR